MGTECGRLDECEGSGGDLNLGDSACPNCPVEAKYRTCSAGQCVLYDRSGTVDAGFVANSAAEGGRSYITMVIDPLMADGTEVKCEALMNTCGLIDNFGLNVVNVQLGQPPTPIARDLAFRATASAHVGSNRLVLLQVVSNTSGSGRILTQGCADGVSIESGQTTQVLIELAP